MLDLAIANPGLYRAAFANKSLALFHCDVEPSTLAKLYKAESNWIAVTELDPRYSDEEWLRKIRRWPPQPIKDLMNFIDLK